MARGGQVGLGTVHDEAYGDEEEMDGSPSDWALRCQETHVAWKREGPLYKDQFMEFLPINLNRSKQRALSYQRQLQSEVDAWCPPPCGCCDKSDWKCLVPLVKEVEKDGGDEMWRIEAQEGDCTPYTTLNPNSIPRSCLAPPTCRT